MAMEQHKKEDWKERAGYVTRDGKKNSNGEGYGYDRNTMKKPVTWKRHAWLQCQWCTH